MSHNISTKDGKAQAWYAGKAPWHGLGTVEPDTRDARGVIEQVPIFQKRVQLVPVYIKVQGKLVEAEGFRATVRDGEAFPLGVMTDSYEVMQDSDGLYLLQAVIKAAKVPAFASAFALGIGARCAASLDLGKVIDLTIKRDPSRHEGFLFGTWAHDGTGSMSIGLADFRVDCQNLLNAATASANSKGLLVRIQHKGDVKAHMEDARRILGFIEQQAKQHVKLMNDLAEIPVPKRWVPEFTEELIPIPEDAKRPKSREEARAVVQSLYQNSKRMRGVPQSAYRLHQAVVEYADHWRPLRIGQATKQQIAERRFRSSYEGPAAELKARSLELLQQEFMDKVPVRVR